MRGELAHRPVPEPGGPGELLRASDARDGVADMAELGEDRGAGPGVVVGARALLGRGHGGETNRPHRQRPVRPVRARSSTTSAASTASTTPTVNVSPPAGTPTPRQVNGMPRAESGSGPSISWKWRCGSVVLPGVPDAGDRRSGPDRVPGLHLERAALEVGVERERTVAEVEDHVVADDPVRADDAAYVALDQHQVEQRRAASCG